MMTKKKGWDSYNKECYSVDLAGELFMLVPLFNNM